MRGRRVAAVGGRCAAPLPGRNRSGTGYREAGGGSVRPPLSARRLAPDTSCANTIFQRPWWLEALAPGSWGETVIERDGRTVARLPWVVRGRGRLRMLTQPPLTQTLGPWIEASTAKQANALAREMALLTELEARLPPAAAFVQHFSPTMLNGLPFYWAGYRLELRYTYRLEGLRSQEALWDGLRGNIRTDIRKARRRLKVRDDLGLDRLHSVWAKTFARQGLEPPQPLAVLERLDAACAAHGARASLFAQDDRGRVHAVAYVVWDEHAGYYLLGGADPALRTSGASSLLVWEAILRVSRATDTFDFEGSMMRPVERSFRAFGSRQAPYLRVTRTSPPMRAALALRGGWQRLAAERRRGSRKRIVRLTTKTEPRPRRRA